MHNERFADLEIRVIDKLDYGIAELTVNHEQFFGEGKLDLSVLHQLFRTPSEEQGKQLFDWLFADEKLKKAWIDIRGRYPSRRIRLRIDTDLPEIHALPWELLREERDDHTALDLAASAGTPFSRYLAGSWQVGVPIFQRPLKILVAIPSPNDLTNYGFPEFFYDEEWKNLQTALKGADVQLTPLPTPCTLTTLQRELRKGYHVLHILTHGRYVDGNERAEIVMEDDAKNTVFVHEDEFAEMLARLFTDVKIPENERLRLIFLDSCETAMRSLKNAFRGFAPALVKAGVPAVLAMQERIAVTTAQAFASAFYRCLLGHGQVDLACNEARSELITARADGASIPVLFMRLRDGMLLGQRGHTSSGNDNFWPFLVENIADQQCIPILGPEILQGLLPSAQYIASELASTYGYPFDDNKNLARVAQYMETVGPGRLLREHKKLMRDQLLRTFAADLDEEKRKALLNADFVRLVEELQWSHKVQQLQENEIHHVLATLNLPLYVTTGFDNFMVQALRSVGKHSVRQIGIRWDYAAHARTPLFPLLPAPSPDDPVVLHLSGYYGNAEQEKQIVFSEKHYLQQFAIITQQRDYIIPTNVLGLLAQSNFLLLGFNPSDWEFRLIVQGLLPSIAQTNNEQRSHIGVQIDNFQQPNSEKAISFLNKFLAQCQIDVYWGTPQQFINELHDAWRA